MAVKIVSKNKVQLPVAKVEVTSALTVTEQLADRLGELSEKRDALMKKIKPFVDEYEFVLKELLEQVEATSNPEDEATIVGEKYKVEFGPKGNRTEITDTDKARQLLDSVQEGLFLQLAKIGITDLKKYLTPAQLEQVTKTERTTKRREAIKKLVPKS